MINIPPYPIEFKNQISMYFESPLNPVRLYFLGLVFGWFQMTTNLIRVMYAFPLGSRTDTFKATPLT